MRCFACLTPYSHRRRASLSSGTLMSPPESPPRASVSLGKSRTKSSSDIKELETPCDTITARSFTFVELQYATQNFRDSNLIGEGGFGKVYKGRIDSGQEIAAKRLCSDAHQGNQEFIVEVLMLSLLHHHNLVNMIGYCAEGDHRVLVYEYMPEGSLADHLFGREKKLDWKTRMKIAVGAAQGIEYLHCQARPPVIYRDLKSANILLDCDFNPKLSDFGMAKLAPSGDESHVSTRVMGTYGYCAPDYAMSGKLTLKSDIFSFGVVLLELITGRMAYDPRRQHGEQSLVVWTRPYLRDRKRYVEMVDPELQGKFPVRTARHLISVASMLLRDEPNLRPPITEIVEALTYLESEGQNHSAGSSSSSSSSTTHQPLMPTSSQQAYSHSHRRIYTRGYHKYDV